MNLVVCHGYPLQVGFHIATASQILGRDSPRAAIGLEDLDEASVSRF